MYPEQKFTRATHRSYCRRTDLRDRHSDDRFSRSLDIGFIGTVVVNAQRFFYVVIGE